MYRLCIADDGPKTADPTLAPLFLGIVPHFRRHRLKMTLEEGAAVPSHTAAIRVWIQDLKAKHLQIF